MLELKPCRKYVRKKDHTYEVYVVGRSLLLPDKVDLVIYITLIDGKCKSCKEEIFHNSYEIALS